MKLLYRIKNYMKENTVGIAKAMATISGSVEDYIYLSQMEEK